MTTAASISETAQDIASEDAIVRGPDLACAGAVHRLMGRVEHYLRCTTDPRADDPERELARRQLMASMQQELLHARVLSKPPTAAFIPAR